MSLEEKTRFFDGQIVYVGQTLLLDGREYKSAFPCKVIAYIPENNSYILESTGENIFQEEYSIEELFFREEIENLGFTVMDEEGRAEEIRKRRLEDNAAFTNIVPFLVRNNSKNQ